MTSSAHKPSAEAGGPLPGPRGPTWRLQDAKARFSEVVRRVHQEGPQHVTVHGRDEVVIVSAAEYDRLKSEPTGQALIDAMQASPHRDIELTTGSSIYPPVRDITL